MKVRRIVEITIPDGTRHKVTGRELTDDQIIASMIDGARWEIFHDIKGNTEIDQILIVTEPEGDR